MNWWRRLLQREGQEASLAKELSLHREQRVVDLMRSGVSEEEARRRIRLEFGGTEQVKEDCRDVRRARWVETLSQDFRYVEKPAPQSGLRCRGNRHIGAWHRGYYRDV